MLHEKKTPKDRTKVRKNTVVYKILILCIVSQHLYKIYTATSGRFFMSVGVFEEKRPMDVSCGNVSMDVAPY